MILFSEDWAKYPNAIVDTSTTNESFIHMARLYKHMGVANHAWPLALVHPQLQGVDPHSPDLTIEQKILIRLECDANPWYVFREMIRLPPNAGIEPIRYKANRGNLALMFCFYNHVDAANIQPRQTGKSGSTDCLSVDVMDIRASNTMMYLITKDAQLRQANIERLKGIRSYLPDYMLTLTRDDADNQNELTNKSRGNRYRTGVGRSAESSANNLGRGMTAAVFHNDEGPFTPWIGVTLEAALASGTAAREQAKKANQPYGNIFTTTSGKKDSRDGRYMYEMIHAGATWDERFLDARNQAEFEDMVRKAGRSKKALANITMSHRQLGLTDQWLEDAMANALRNPEATKDGVERDFMNVWTSGSQSSPLSPKLNGIIHDSECDPYDVEITSEKYSIYWYIPKESIAEIMDNGWFIMGADTSEAIGRDVTAMVVLDIRDLSVVARFSVNETNILTFSEALAKFMIRYRRIILIPEKKSTGQSVVDILTVKLHAAGQDPFKRIFNRIVDEHNEKQELYRMIQNPVYSRPLTFYDTVKSMFGFNTSNTTRQLLYGSVLQEAAKTAGHLVRDATLSREIRELVVKNDRIDHRESGNDDHVTAWLLAHWFVRFARNLQFYGIDPAYVMRDAIVLDAELDSNEAARLEKQKSLLAEIDALIERVETTKHPILKIRYENRLQQLTSLVDPELMPTERNIDQLMSSAKSEQSLRRKTSGGSGRITLGGNRFSQMY